LFIEPLPVCAYLRAHTPHARHRPRAAPALLFATRRRSWHEPAGAAAAAMPVITVQLGQCGNQLGFSLFETLAAELDRQEYGVDGWETFFRPAAAAAGRRDKACTARAVLVDMEPKVPGRSCTSRLPGLPSGRGFMPAPLYPRR
jgi:tubulin delta